MGRACGMGGIPFVVGKVKARCLFAVRFLNLPV